MLKMWPNNAQLPFPFLELLVSCILKVLCPIIIISARIHNNSPYLLFRNLSGILFVCLFFLKVFSSEKNLTIFLQLFLLVFKQIYRHVSPVVNIKLYNFSPFVRDRKQQCYHCGLRQCFLEVSNAPPASFPTFCVC